MSHPFDVNWSKLLARLPASVDLEASARSCGALKRRRTIKTAPSLLRLVMSNAVGHLSLRGTAAWATLQGMPLSNPSVHQRLKRAAQWMAYLVAEVLAARIPARLRGGGAGLHLRLIDATSLSAPGSRGTDWRLHVAYDLGQTRITEVELTDGRGSESLSRFALKPGHLAIGDRGYAKAPDLAAMADKGTDYIVRTGWNATRLRTRAGGCFNLLRALRGTREHETREFQLAIALDRAEKQLLPVRLIALRKSDIDAAASVRRVRKDGQRHGKTPKRETFEAAKYVFLLTSLAPDQAAADEVLALYRLRWQIELLFKRLKSLLRIDELPNKDPAAARCWILANLLAALLLEDQARLFLDTPPSAPCFARRRPLPVAHPSLVARSHHRRDHRAARPRRARRTRFRSPPTPRRSCAPAKTTA